MKYLVTAGPETRIVCNNGFIGESNLFGAMLEEMAYEQGMDETEMADIAAEMLA